MTTTMEGTLVYLTKEQKKQLSAKARERGTKVAAEIRRAVDVYLMGISPEEMELLDDATRRAKEDIDAMIAALRRSNDRSDHIFAQIRKLQTQHERRMG